MPALAGALTGHRLARQRNDYQPRPRLALRLPKPHPAHAQPISQQLLDPSINVRIGVRYLRDLLDLFSDDLSLALAAYNAGEQSVRDSGNRIPPYKETREYVDLVRQFQAMYAPPEPPIAAPARPRIDVRAVHDTRLSSMQAP